MGKGPAIIISPLLALMKDQIESEIVEKTNLIVKEINSENQDKWNDIYSAIRANKVDAIMIAPEKLNNEKFLSEIQNILPYISLFVVDEAHCISDWGHDFKVSFRLIARFVRAFLLIQLYWPQQQRQMIELLEILNINLEKILK